VVDYCICNARVVNIFVTLKVLEFSKLFSDVHCPLSICLNVKTNCLDNTTESSQKGTERVNKWDNEKLLNFQSNINQDDLNRLLYNLSESRTNFTNDKVNTLVNNLSEIFLNSAKSTFGIFRCKNCLNFSQA
jgi:hypothetical protein